MRQLFNTKLKIIIIVAVLLTAALSVMAGLTNHSIPELLVQGILAPFRAAGTSLTKTAERYYSYMFRYEALEAENEALKKQVACCTKSEFEGVMEVRGHSWETNLPARHVIYTRDLYEPVQELASRIAAAARAVLESTPPELAADYPGRSYQLFEYVFRVDQHKPFTCAGVPELIARIAPEYLTFEFISNDLPQLKRMLHRQQNVFQKKT